MRGYLVIKKLDDYFDEIIRKTVTSSCVVQVVFFPAGPRICLYVTRVILSTYDLALHSLRN